MSRSRTTRAVGAIGIATLALLAGCAETAGEQTTMLPAASPAGAVPTGNPAGPAARGVEGIENPYVFVRDQAAVRQGEQLYRQMNCADCHGYAGEGGMCPSLTDGEWLFGDTPADKFISIHRGRARGMPAYGHMLPDESIWKIVAYLDELRQRAAEGGGRRAGGGDDAQSTRTGQQVGGRH